MSLIHYENNLPYMVCTKDLYAGTRVIPAGRVQPETTSQKEEAQ